jgi:hypothetical protein
VRDEDRLAEGVRAAQAREADVHAAGHVAASRGWRTLRCRSGDGCAGRRCRDERDEHRQCGDRGGAAASPRATDVSGSRVSGRHDRPPGRSVGGAGGQRTSAGRRDGTPTCGPSGARTYGSAPGRARWRPHGSVCSPAMTPRSR